MDLMYTYRSLDPTEDTATRILKLKPSANKQAELECDLLHIPVTRLDRPKYEAISYTWDDQKPSKAHYILCGNGNENEKRRRLNVTRNSEAALRHLRLKDSERYLWLDFVCINQSSPVERTFHVRNMGAIYTFADSVIVWLGNAASSECELTVRYMEQFAALDPDDNEDLSKLNKLSAEILKNARLLRPQGLAFDSREHWSIMDYFFRLPWFGRVWTLQELALNLQDAVFHIGELTIKWSTIMAARASMKACGCDQLVCLDNAMDPFVKLKHVLREWRSAIRAGSLGSDGPVEWHTFQPPSKYRPQLTSILAEARNRACQEPKDKVFGVFGICQWLDVWMPDPDYEKDIEQIFFEVTRAVIYADEDLNVLYNIPAPGRNSMLPSWVPDWEHGWSDRYSEPLAIIETHMAGGSKNAGLIEIDHERRVLKTHGKIVDHISHCSERIPLMEKMPLSAIAEFLHDIDNLERLWKSWAVFCNWNNLFRQSFDHANQAMEVYFATILQGHTSTPSFLASEGHDLKAFFRSWYKALVETQEMMETKVNSKDKDTINRIRCMHHMPETAGYDIGVYIFHLRAWSFAAGRSFFTTYSSRMGTCQGQVEEGDVVAIVPGTSLPLILRKSEDNYTLVGYGYFHEVMDGKIWHSDKYKRKIIKIL